MYIPDNRKRILDKFQKLVQNPPEIFRIKQARNSIPPWVETTRQLTPPFTYFGGKRGIALEVWRRFGIDIPNYIEPFSGGLSVLLARPIADLRNLSKFRELANNTNILLLNFWRSVQQTDIAKLVQLMDFPAHERELTSRRASMMKRRYELEKIIDDEKACDPELAAYWLYVQRQWIGGGADDPNTIPFYKMIRAKESGYLGASISEHLKFLQSRTRHVRFFVKDWDRPLQSLTQLTNIGITGVFLDPPYIDTTDYYGGRLNTNNPGNRIPLESREWALKNGQNPKLRIAYCGYLHHHEGFFPEGGENGWTKICWKIANGYAGKDKTNQIETIWFSPHCLKINKEI